MTDKQFLEFLELSEANLDFSKFISILFPGASKIFLDQPLEQQVNRQKVPPPMVNDLSAVKSEMVEFSLNSGANFNSNDVRNQIGKTLANQKE
jgi:hypothetical protein